MEKGATRGGYHILYVHQDAGWLWKGKRRADRTEGAPLIPTKKNDCSGREKTNEIERGN